jgi:hypothetical protein
MRAGDFGRTDPGAVGKCDQETLVAEHMLEHAGEKVRRTRGIANAVRANPGRRDERAQPLGLFRDKGKLPEWPAFLLLGARVVMAFSSLQFAFP